MGLDLVEMVLRIEDTFGVEIPDEVATTLETPRLVIDFLLTRLDTRAPRTCISQEAFYFLRRKVLAQTSFPRERFHPRTTLEEVFPKKNRRELWRNLSSEIGGKDALPDLVRPDWLRLSIAFICLGIFILIAAGVNYSASHITATFVIGLPATFGAAALLIYLTQSFQNQFALDYQKIGDLVEYSISHHVCAFKTEGWTREQIAGIVWNIIEEETGVDVSKFNEDSYFIRDMNLD